MAVVVIRQTESLVVDFGGELEGVVEGEGGGEEGGGAVGGIGIGEGGGAGVVDEAGDVFVAVVEVVEGGTGGVAENEGTRGDGFGGIPDVGLIRDVVDTAELLNAKEVFVEETLLKVGSRRNRAHFDTAAHAVKGHGDHGVARLPANGAVFGVVDDRPNTCLGLDEGLIAIVVVLWREVVNRRVLIEIVGGVGFAFGGRAVSDVVVVVGDLIGRNEFIADVVTVLLVIL